GGNFAAGNGSNENLAAISNLGDTATINLEKGLRFWAETDANFLFLVLEENSEITVKDPSFEINSGGEMSPGGSNNGIAPDWEGRDGGSAGGAFEEYIDGFAAEGTDNVGMETGYYIWQDTGVAIAPYTTYTLTVAAGNRNANFSSSGNASIYGLLAGATNLGAQGYANTAAVIGDTFLTLASGSVDASRFDEFTFGDGAPLVFTTGATVPNENLVILLGDNSAGGRSHFDNIRLDARSGLSLASLYESRLDQAIIISASLGNGLSNDYNYQWSLNGNPIPASAGGNQPKFSINGLAKNEGSWKVVISDSEETYERAFEYRIFVDTDGDGLSDYREQNLTNTNFEVVDTDEDGLSDGAEVALGTDPLVVDTDGDGYSDSLEVEITLTDPLLNSLNTNQLNLTPNTQISKVEDRDGDLNAWNFNGSEFFQNTNAYYPELEISFWVKPAQGNPPYSTIFGFGNSDGWPSYSLNLNSITYDEQSGIQESRPVTIPADQWSFVSFQISQHQLSGNFNGQEVQFENPNPGATSSANLIIGTGLQSWISEGDKGFLGQISDLKVNGSFYGASISQLESKLWESNANEEVLVDASESFKDASGYLYQWYFEDTLIPTSEGGNEVTYSINGVPENEGTWKVLISDRETIYEQTFEYRIFVDTDGDGLSDYREQNLTNTNFQIVDTDEDGLSDGEEVTLGTDPLVADTDEDGFSDAFEVKVLSTNPLTANSLINLGGEQANAAIVDGLVEYWDLDGDYNAGVDASHAGTLVTTGNGSGTFVTGKFGSAIDLANSGGNQAYITVGGDENDMDFADGNMSFSAWYTTESLYTSWQTLAGKGE
ncbi:hypothetical protein OAP01_13125, partial [Akkermansiaceae bacterium]|nr:hypothetical protein [Akkermansiaceae bacterium]